jgi:putative ABC transport system permease protein
VSPSVLDIAAMALRGISRNRLRSSLTMLGIVIGVAAVIAMVHFGESTRRAVTAQIASLGQNLLIASPGAGRGMGGARVAGRPFEWADVQAIARDVPGLDVAPTAQAQAQVVWGNANWPSSVLGVTDAFFTVRDWAVAEGRTFDPAEAQAGAPVCLLGATPRRELFGDGDPLEARIRVGKVACRVIGVLASKQAAMGQDPDDVVVMPLRTVQRRVLGNRDVGTIFVSARDASQTTQVQAEVERLLRERRRLKADDPDDFRVRDMKEIADRVEGTTAFLSALLAGIAAVSLLVGGIGIMNIMLVSVTERTREIGLRMAVGARGGDVMWQFLIESVLLSLVGGALGVVVGLGGTWFALRELAMDFHLVPGIVLLAFVFAAAIGVVFGFFPARRAARLNPIEALRHE